jgi:hypothetical protein
MKLGNVSVKRKEGRRRTVWTHVRVLLDPSIPLQTQSGRKVHGWMNTKRNLVYSLIAYDTSFAVQDLVLMEAEYNVRNSSSGTKSELFWSLVSI